MEKIKNLLNGKNTVRSAAGILIITLLFSNILGLFRDHFLAQKIPTSLLDTYYAAFRIPDLIFNLLVLGAIAAAFIPVFTNYISQKKEEEAWHVANSFLNLIIFSLIIAIGILIFLMPYIIPHLVPNFPADKQDLTVRLARLMMFSPLFFGISYIFGGVLNSYKRFLAYSIAPLIYNLSIILATIFLTSRYSVWGVVYGVLIGAFLHMLIQAPTVFSLGYRYKFVFDWAHAGVKRIFRLMIPRAIGLGAMQAMLLAFTFVASRLSSGSVAIFNLADNIQTMPVVVLGTSFATAIFPTLSEAVSLKKINEFSSYFWRSARAIIYFLIPAGVGIILLRMQIVRLILGSGYFGWRETIDTASVLGFLAISLFAQGLVALFARSFYALHNTKTPMYISIISMFTSIVLAFLFSNKMGIMGLGLAFSIGSVINVILLYWKLRVELTEIKKQEISILVFILKIILGTVIMALIVQVDKSLIGKLVNMDRFWGVFVQTLSAIILGGGAYILITWLAGCEEIKELVELIKRKISSSDNVN